ncbi:ribosome biogenesis protein Sqt1 [Cantharellus anzutake]|uniref:ribosome biogenesis protein Sqt1 n=1 Tax=Cantharellus anzutake TaxID=1750568 RepID=UPI0019070010|nr:ribosome biogenesis protein Sqt1 [Cantharellus anzutake]KAF8340497.1 ribosome biogenesis protein Sqt1 [Cantharellus anzutake]
MEDESSSDEEHFIDPSDILAVDEGEGDGDVPMDDADDDEHDPGSPSLQQSIQDNVIFEDNSIQQFPNHQKSVFSISVHPTLPIAASGGQDDLGYLWNFQNGELIARLSGHTDSVSKTAFSFDGTLVATGGMDGKVRLWRLLSGDPSPKHWEFLTEINGPDEVLWLEWHPKGSVLLAGSGDGTVWMWQLPSGNVMQVFAGHESSVQAGGFTPDGKKIVSVDASGNLILWDPRSPAPVWKLNEAADGRFSFDGGITSVSANPSSTLAVVGGADGIVRVVNLAKGSVIGALEGHQKDESVEAITFLDFGSASVGQGSGIVATGGTDGKICIWDLTTMKIRTTLEHESSVTKLLTHPVPHGHLLTSASADTTLKTWDARAGKLLRHHVGHQGPVFDAALGLGGTVVVSAGDDGICLVFGTDQP